MLFIDRGREKGKFSSIFLMTWPGLCNESCGTGTFSCFFKGYQEAWHSYFREKFECNTETSVIWQHSCLSLECPYSRSDCTTYPPSFSRWFQLMLTGVLSFRFCSYFVIFDDCGFIIPLSILSRLCALSPSLSKKLVTPEFLQDRQSFPFRPAHIRRHGARTVTVKRGRADRDNFPNVAYPVVGTTLSEMFTPGSE